VAALLSLVGQAVGQVNPGFPSFTPQDCGQYDCINLQNLNVSVNIPIMSKSGAFPFSFYANGLQSYVENPAGTILPGDETIAGTPTNGLSMSANAIGPFAPYAWYTTKAIVTCPSGDGTGTATKYTGWYIVLSDGTNHPLPATDAAYVSTSCAGSFTDTTIDGSGYTATISSSTSRAFAELSSVVTSGGMTILTTPLATTQSVTDSNGNNMSFNPVSSGLPFSSATWTDTLGLTALTQSSTGLSWSWTDANGNSPAATAGTDAAGIAGLFLNGKVAKLLGPLTAAVSIYNDPSTQNQITNLLDWGANNSTPGPQKVDPYGPQILQPALPVQDECAAFGMGPSCN
jgi:hypothetical protein